MEDSSDTKHGSTTKEGPGDAKLVQPTNQECPDSQPTVTLHGFTPKFGVPSSGPFAIKTEIQLKMMGLPYRKIIGRYDIAPKGKLPFIEDLSDGTIVADSTFIRIYLEKKYSKDLDNGLNDTQRAIAYAAERLVEDSLYWAMVHTRWAVEENFEKGPARVFDALPAEVRDTARQKQRAKVLGYLDGQGLGRHSREEIMTIARKGYWALSQILGDKLYLTGDRPCGADASVFAQIASALTDFFDEPLRDIVKEHENLVRYHDRMMKTYFPDFV